jgi:hypothetical protein
MINVFSTSKGQTSIATDIEIIQIGYQNHHLLNKYGPKLLVSKCRIKRNVYYNQKKKSKKYIPNKFSNGILKVKSVSSKIKINIGRRIRGH